MVNCSSTQQLTVETPLYKNRASMKITVDGITYDGMAVGKLDGPKKIQLISQAALDLLRITTCHRDFSVEKVDKGWFGGSGHLYTYEYHPTDVEKSKVCPMYIQAFSKDRVTDWGFIAFRTDETIPAEMQCNGWWWKSDGISVCQTKAGLDQKIKFDRDVLYEAEPSCSITAKSKREFVVRGSMGFCYAEFSDGKEWHRLILLGYDSVLIRGD